MSNFSKSLNEAMDDLLNKEGVSSTRDTLKVARDVLKQHEEAAGNKRDEINATMAFEMKKLLSNVESTLRDGVVFKYKSRSISLTPDFETGTWIVSPGGQGASDRRFFRPIGGLNGTPLEQWKEVLQKIAQRFVQYYRTLQGGKVQMPEEPPPVSSMTIPDEVVDEVVDEEGLTDVQPN